MAFSFAERSRFLEQAAETPLDLVVVGGGITGAGVAREAALRGHRVALFERGDFASGTSSRSSKLIHGGVRYLAQGDIALVREAARERAVLRRLAPHLADPVSMVIPASSKASLLKYAAGLWTFDKLAADPDDAHKTYGRDETRSLVPRLRAERLGGSVVFTEFVTNDARLVLENAKSAAAAGALVASYAPVAGVAVADDGVRLTVRDGLGEGAFEVRARAVVNAAGPWFDDVAQLVDPSAEAAVQLTRGIHLVVERTRLPVDHSVVLRSPDKRSTFVVPRGSHVYIGTTDTHYEGGAEEPGVSSDDVSYLLESVGNTFVEPPTPEDVVGVWSGVRPLLRQEGKSPSEISRKDEVRTGPGPVVSIAGGKLTTYRRMAERVVDAAESVAGLKPERASNSAETALIGGDAAAQKAARTEAPSIENARLEDRLWRTYGVAARGIVDRIVADPSLAEPVGGLDLVTRAELAHAVEEEMVLGVDDLLRRRSQAAMFVGEQAAAAAPEAAALLGDALSWSDERRAREAEAFSELVRGELGVVSETRRA